MEKAGERSPIRIAFIGNTIVCAGFMQELEEAKRAPEYVEKVGGRFHTRGPGSCLLLSGSCESSSELTKQVNSAHPKM